MIPNRGPCKQRGLFLIEKWGSRSLEDQASFERSVSFAGKIIDGVSHRCSGLLNLVFESTGSSLKPSLGVFGGGLDLVFETHRFWASG